MPLTRDFKETIQERARRDAAFREALLKEAVDALFSGDVETGKIVLRDYINATVGFDKLATATTTVRFDICECRVSLEKQVINRRKWISTI